MSSWQGMRTDLVQGLLQQPMLLLILVLIVMVVAVVLLLPPAGLKMLQAAPDAVAPAVNCWL
jgi:hypothetical protein